MQCQSAWPPYTWERVRPWTAPAELGGDRHGHGLDDRLHDAARLFRIFHQRSAVAVVDDFGHGTAHVDVDDVGAGMLNGDLSGLCHADRVTAENLYGGGVLAGELLQQRKRLFIVIAQGLGRDQLRNGVTGAQLGTDLAEGHIRYAGHGGQCQAGVDLNGSNSHRKAPFVIKNQFIIPQQGEKVYCKARGRALLFCGYYASI